MIFPTRISGILCHLSSLPSRHGIGDLGPSSRLFIDFLAAAGQSCWQLLPLNPVSGAFDYSPYMSPSALAGNPLFISPELLAREGLLREEEVQPPEFSEYTVDFEAVYAWKEHLVELAASRFDTGDPGYTAFLAAHPWIHDHALFMCLKKQYGQRAWFDWPEPAARRDQDFLGKAGKSHAEGIRRYGVEQYLFFRQWQGLRRYAAENGISLIGDLPIYVALDSVDVWANQEIFQLHPGSGRPTRVAGVPPDYFSATGQRWGNPLYRWRSRRAGVRERLYAWWEMRLLNIFDMVDFIRIDHFRGFEAYWSIPAREKTAVKGRWVKGPGKTFFREMQRRLGPLPVIAEDLGTITPEVEELRRAMGFPGMKVLLFAFGAGPGNAYLPHNYEDPNCVVYTGTHDNDTAVGWFLSDQVPARAKEEAKLYANRPPGEHTTQIHQDLIYLALSSTARLSLIPLQDVLGFGNDCRMNVPGSKSGNWRWRCARRFLRTETAGWLRDMTRRFGRLVEPPRQGEESKGQGRTGE